MVRTFSSDYVLSDGYRDTDIILQWNEHMPVEYTPNMELPEFNFTGVSTKSCDVSYATGAIANSYRPVITE